MRDELSSSLEELAERFLSGFGGIFPGDFILGRTRGELAGFLFSLFLVWGSFFRRRWSLPLFAF